MAANVSQLSAAGVPSQSMTLVAGVEKAPDNVRLLHSSAQVASVPHQARHRVSHRTLLGAATAYVAILAVAFLILVCARRLSNLTVGEGRVRSLASAGGDEPAGACGGSAEGEGEEEDHEGDAAWREAIIQQAKENIEAFKVVVKKLRALRGASKYPVVACSTSIYIMMATEMGALAAFIDRELQPLRSLWSGVLKDLVACAEDFNSDWKSAGQRLVVQDAHFMSSHVVELLRMLRTSPEQRSRYLPGNRWILLSNLVRVQAQVPGLASSYLSEVGPESKGPNTRRREAMTRLAGLSDVRRRMILRNPAFGAYFGGLPSRRFAKRRFGVAAVEAAQKENLPSTPEDQIEFLKHYFPMHLRERAPEPPAAIPVPTPSTAAPYKKKKAKAPPSKELPTQPSPPPQQFPEPPQSGQWPPMQPPASSPASGPGPQGVDPYAPLGARPKSYSQAAAPTGEKSSGLSSKKSSSKSLRGDLKDAEPGPYAGPAVKLLPRLALSSQPQTTQSSATVLKGSAGLRRRRGPKTEESKPKDATPSDKEEASSGLGAGAEGGKAKGKPSPAGPSGAFPGAAIPPFPRLSHPSAFTGPPRLAGPVRQQRPAGPSAPLPPTSGSPSFGTLLGTVQHPLVRGPPPLFPSTPFPSAPIPPTSSQPTAKDSQAFPSQSSTGVSPQLSTSVPSVRAPYPPLCGTPSIWAPLPSSQSGSPTSGPFLLHRLTQVLVGPPLQGPQILTPDLSPRNPRYLVVNLRHQIQVFIMGRLWENQNHQKNPSPPPPHPVDLVGSKCHEVGEQAIAGKVLLLSKRSLLGVIKEDISEASSVQASDDFVERLGLAAAASRHCRKADVRPLGAFTDKELRRLKQLWLSVMKEALESAQALDTGWGSTGVTSSMKDLHFMNGDLLELVGLMRTGTNRQKLVVKGSRWVALQTLIKVQAVTLELACAYLSVLDPVSKAGRQARRRALSKIGSLSDARRRMVLADRSFADYFASFQLRRFVRKIGASAAQTAQHSNLPFNPEDQIKFLLEHFPTDLGAQPQDAATAVSTPSPTDTTPALEGEKSPLPPQVLPMQPPGFSLQPAGPPEPPQAPSAQLQGTPMKHGLKALALFEKLGARPKTHSTEAATGGKKSSGMPSKKPLSGVPHVAQLHAGTPKRPTSAGLPFAPYSDTDASTMHAQQATTLLPQEQVPFSSTPLAAPGTPVSPRIPGVRPVFSPRWNAFFGFPQGAPGPLNAEPSVPPGLSGPPRFPGPVRHTLQRPPGPPEGPPGVPRPPILRPPVPPGSSGPSRFPAPGPLECPWEIPPISTFQEPSPPRGLRGPARQILQRPPRPLEGPLAAPRSPILGPSSPHGLPGPATQILQRPPGPSGGPPWSSEASHPQAIVASRDPHSLLVLSLQQVEVKSSSHLLELCNSPSAGTSLLLPQHHPPSALHPSSPSQPTIGRPTLLSASQPSTEGSPAHLTSVQSALETLPPLLMQRNVDEPSSSGQSARAVSEGSASEASPTQEESSPSTSAAFHGEPTDEMKPSVTSVSTAPPPS
ncbi:hypothetical protein Emed_007315 [Eimeria media]